MLSLSMMKVISTTEPRGGVVIGLKYHLRTPSSSAAPCRTWSARDRIRRMVARRPSPTTKRCWRNWLAVPPATAGNWIFHSLLTHGVFDADERSNADMYYLPVDTIARSKLAGSSCSTSANESNVSFTRRCVSAVCTNSSGALWTISRSTSDKCQCDYYARRIKPVLARFSDRPRQNANN